MEIEIIIKIIFIPVITSVGSIPQNIWGQWFEVIGWE